MNELISKNKYLAALIVLAAATLVLKYYAQLVLGPDWDTYSFSLNALEYAGKSIGYYEYDRGPFFPFILSIFFRLGFVSEKTAMIVDAAFLFLGTVFLYLLVGLKFSRLIAFLSGVVFISAKIMVTWAAVGYADIASMTLSIMTLYFFVRGMDGESRLLLLAWPLAMCAFLSRTTAALIILPMAFYYLFVPMDRRKLMYNLAGVFLGLMVFLPVARFYLINGADPLFYVKMVFGGLSASGESVGVEKEIYTRGTYYFFDELKNFMLNGYLYPVLAAMVLIGGLMLVFKFISVSKKRPNTIILLVLFSAVAYLLFERLSFMQMGGLTFLMMSYLYFHSNPNDDNRSILFAFMMVLWGISYFMFHSTFYQKVPRYYITMMPSIAFLATISIIELSRNLDAFVRREGLLSKLLPALLLVSMVVTSSEVIYGTFTTSESDPFLQDYHNRLEMSQWIEGNIADLDESLVYSDDWVYFAWYAKHNIISMPFYFDDAYIGHEIMKYGVDYYITHHAIEIASAETLYEVEVYRFLDIVDYAELPRGLYIGSGWENYFEYVLGFSSYLIDGETHVRQASDFIDDFSLEELSGYDYLALFNFKWRSASRAEELLEAYLGQGGLIIVDCSGNLDDPLYSLNYKQFLNMMVYRAELPRYSLVDTYDAQGQYVFSDFGSDASHWFGATYSAVGEEPDIETLATVNGNVFVAIERYGGGKVLWLGFNEVFHAFSEENLSEMDFLRYAFERAISP